MGEWMGRLQEKMRDNFLAEDLDPRLPYVQVVGDKRVLIENHTGIVEYSDTVMRVSLGGMELCIGGEGMDLTVLTLRELTIEGRIHTLEYSRRSG